MARVKAGPQSGRKHRKVLKLAKGYQESRSKLFKRAHEAVIRAGEHAFKGRKERKRQFRRLWIARLTGALADKDINYSRFINGLKKANIELNRKMLSDMAIRDEKGFDEIVKKAKTAK